MRTRAQVRDTGSGEEFAGTSPTHPWTAVCLSKRLGTRISGPLFFGFSDHSGDNPHLFDGPGGKLAHADSSRREIVR